MNLISIFLNCSYNDGVSAAMFTSEDKAMASRIVCDALRSAVEDRPLQDWSDSGLPLVFLEESGCFVTLYKEGNLRGCIGFTSPIGALWKCVQEAAVAAATRDSRFPTVVRNELAELNFEVSVLSPLADCSDVAEIQIGVHGLSISQGNKRGLLLPQVASEHGWDRETFLSQTCRKARLPEDAWRHGACIKIFTVERFAGDVSLLRN